MTENDTTEPLQQPSTDGRLQKIEETLAQLLIEMRLMREETNLRYADLRNRIELNNDKLDVVQRELRQLIKDTRSPLFTA